MFLGGVLAWRQMSYGGLPLLVLLEMLLVSLTFPLGMFGWFGLVQLGWGMHDPHFPATSAYLWFHQMFCLESHSGLVHTLSWKVLPCPWFLHPGC